VTPQEEAVVRAAVAWRNAGAQDYPNTSPDEVNALTAAVDAYQLDLFREEEARANLELQHDYWRSQ
jgi:hypothetical protein